jgi:hypothetical protein
MERELENNRAMIGIHRQACTFLLLVVAVSVLLTADITAGDDPPGDIEGARTTLEKWVETRRIISKERQDWALGQEVLEDRIEIVQREIDSLRSRIRDAEESISEADKKRADLLEENELLKEASAALESTVVMLENRTRQLLVQLPDPIRERVKPLSQRFPEDPEDTKLSLAERFQNVVGILNEVNKFNREITVTSEVRTLPDGTTAEVTALYVGIGQGYYASADGKSAGVGTGSAEGWTWTPANQAAADITRAIKILKNEEAAGFVQMPIRIE